MNALDDNPDALANANAALSKRRQMRREAMQRGDQGSPVAPILTDAECGPLHFQPIPCTGCGVKLTSQNHGCGKQCERCFEETQALRAFEDARLRLIAENNAALARKARKVFVSSLWTILPAVIGLIGVVFLVKWLWEASK